MDTIYIQGVTDSTLLANISSQLNEGTVLVQGLAEATEVAATTGINPLFLALTALIGSVVTWFLTRTNSVEGVSQAIHDAVVEQVAALKATIIELRETITNLTSTNDALTKKDAELRNTIERQADKITALEDEVEAITTDNILIDLDNAVALRDEATRQKGFHESRMKNEFGLKDISAESIAAYADNHTKEEFEELAKEFVGYGKWLKQEEIYTAYLAKRA